MQLGNAEPKALHIIKQIWEGQQVIPRGSCKAKVNKIPIKSAIDSAFLYKHKKGFLCSKDFLSGIYRGGGYLPPRDI